MSDVRFVRRWVSRFVLTGVCIAPMIGGAPAHAIVGCIGPGGTACDPSAPANTISYCAETSGGASADGNSIDLVLLDNNGTVSLVIPTDAGTVFIDATGRDWTSGQRGHVGVGVVGGPAAGIGDAAPNCPWG